MIHRPAAPALPLPASPAPAAPSAPRWLLALSLLPALLLPPLLLASPAAAREPSGEERGRVEAALREQGYQAWGSIALEDGIWEVEDAAAADGTRRNLRLTPDALRIIATDRDDRLADAEDMARIEESLRRLGYTGFGRARLADGLWEVDRARASDGQDYELTLERDTLRVLHRERQD